MGKHISTMERAGAAIVELLSRRRENYCVAIGGHITVDTGGPMTVAELEEILELSDGYDLSIAHGVTDVV